MSRATFVASVVLYLAAGAVGGALIVRHQQQTEDVKQRASAEHLREIEGRLQQLETNLLWANDMIDMEATNIIALHRSEAKRLSHMVSIDPTEQKGYVAVAVPAGSLLLSVRNVEPYLDGYKLNLDIGNPTTATFPGCALYSEWAGATNGDGSLVSTSKHEHINERLLPGQWTSTEITVSPASLQQLKTLKLRLSAPTLEMQPPKNQQ
ncbi:MAG TPA: hypothetical protein VHA37_04360 [Candidatus Saccharimonadales bacterium]|nr:hypothetical protein [Candidatus Saccharimonadales bacterium]